MDYATTLIQIAGRCLFSRVKYRDCHKSQNKVLYSALNYLVWCSLLSCDVPILLVEPKRRYMACCNVNAHILFTWKKLCSSTFIYYKNKEVDHFCTCAEDKCSCILKSFGNGLGSRTPCFLSLPPELCDRCYINIHFYMFIINYIYTPVKQQTHSCYCCSGVILNHTTSLDRTRSSLPLIGYILLINAHLHLSPKMKRDEMSHSVAKTERSTQSSCVSIQGLHPLEEHLKANYVITLREGCPNSKAPPDAPLRSFVALHIPRFFACPKKEKEGRKWRHRVV